MDIVYTGRVCGGGRQEASQGEVSALEGTIRANIRPGQRVRIVQKGDQATGHLTEGVVRDLLTKSPTHPHGIKVRLEEGAVGRVKEIVG